MDTMTANAESKRAPSAALLQDLIDEHQFACEFDVSLKTARRWRERQRGPKFLRIGRRVFYRKSSIAEWLRACEQQPERRDLRRKRRTA